MSEAIIARGGYPLSESSSGGGSGATNAIITVNGYYSCTKTGNYMVTCVGGGAGGSAVVVSGGYRANFRVAGGSSGFLNSNNVLLNNGDTIYVTIGEGGSSATINIASSRNSYHTPYMEGKSGGITAFGSYVYASGGSAAQWDNQYNQFYFSSGGYNNGSFNNGYSSNTHSLNWVSVGTATGGWLYYNTPFTVTKVSQAMRLYYGEGGNSANCITTVNFYWENTPNAIIDDAPQNGNRGIVLIQYID